MPVWKERVISRKTRLNALERVHKGKLLIEGLLDYVRHKTGWGGAAGQEDHKGNSESSTQMFSKGPLKTSLHLNETKTKNCKQGMHACVV